MPTVCHGAEVLHSGKLGVETISMNEGVIKPPTGASEICQDRGPQDDVFEIGDIDWNRVWQALRERKGFKKRSSQFWDSRSSSFAEGVLETQYADAFLDLVKPEPDWCVLDMGCGSGTLAIPLAKIVSSVTAVDFSSGMLDVVRSWCDSERIVNMTTIQASWEDDWEVKGIGSYDVAIASRSMVALDLRTSIEKLNNVAKKRVYISTIVGYGPYDKSLLDAIGRPLRRTPDYIYTYNLLYQMGIYGNVNFIKEKRERIFVDINDAATALHWMIGDLSKDELIKLQIYLKSSNTSSPSDFLKHVYEITWAIIWWKK
jgi:SAM-dependent methyltransferase